MAWKELIDESKIGAAGGVAGIDSSGRLTIPVAGFDRDIVIADLNITKEDIGLGNVENKSAADILAELTAADIPDLDITQITGLTTALDSKVPTTRKVAGKSLEGDISLTKSDVGLGNVENKSSADIYDGLTAEHISATGVKTSDLISMVTTLPAVGDPGEIAMKDGVLYVWRDS